MHSWRRFGLHMSGRDQALTCCFIGRGYRGAMGVADYRRNAHRIWCPVVKRPSPVERADTVSTSNVLVARPGGGARGCPSDLPGVLRRAARSPVRSPPGARQHLSPQLTATAQRLKQLLGMDRWLRHMRWLQQGRDSAFLSPGCTSAAGPPPQPGDRKWPQTRSSPSSSRISQYLQRRAPERHRPACAP